MVLSAICTRNKETVRGILRISALKKVLSVVQGSVICFGGTRLIVGVERYDNELLGNEALFYSQL